MWIALFVIVIAVAICLSGAAIMMGDRDATKIKLTRLLSENALFGTKPIGPGLKALLASPEVRLMMRADHVDKRELCAKLNITSVQLQKNASSIFRFDRAVRRLRNMSEMIDRQGFDAEALARSDLNVGSVFRACQICPADEVCHDWLVRASTSFKRAPAFCPNAERFSRARQVTA
jgi:hypothetical protein